MSAASVADGSGAASAVRTAGAVRPGARHARAVRGRCSCSASVRVPGFASGQVVLNLFIDNAFLLVVGGRHDVRDPHRRHRPLGRLGRRALHADRRALLEKHGWPPLRRRSSSCSLIGSTLGFAMGCVIHYFEIQPFIVTLAGMFLARGLCYAISTESISITTRSGYVDVAERTFTLPGDLYLTIGGDRRRSSSSRSPSTCCTTRRLGRNVYAIGGNAAVGAADGPAGGADEDRRLHDQRLLLGARRRAVLLLHALRLGQPRASAWSSTRSPPSSSAARCSPAASGYVLGIGARRARARPDPDAHQLRGHAQLVVDEDRHRAPAARLHPAAAARVRPQAVARPTFVHHVARDRAAADHSGVPSRSECLSRGRHVLSRLLELRVRPRRFPSFSVAT